MNPLGAYDLAFVDLDGTLLSPDKTVSPANLRALDRLRGAGVQVVAASGRHHANIAAFREIGQSGWTLSSHGAVVRHQRTDEWLLEMAMAPERVAEIAARGRELGMTLIAYHRDGAYIERESEWTDLYASQSGWKPRIADFRSLPADGFQKVIWSEGAERIAAVAPDIQREFQGRAHAVVTDPELLEFLAPAANKAVGARALTEKLGVAPARTLAFGDGNNDVELLRWAGFSVAMNHGRESARKAARFVSPPGPEESAFARAVNLALSTREGSRKYF
jgi:Cof subfamily protein (haloacid dehalogenase superfamily)